jgi:hypothetical protein
VKERVSATIRVIIEKDDTKLNKCVVCGKPAKSTVIFAKSY